MSSSPMALDRAATPEPTTRKRNERLFFSGMALMLAITVFAGFAPTYYLREQFGSPELSQALHAHGLAFTAWMVLLVLQASLVAANKTAVHRSLGVAGAALGVIMMLLGAYVAITRIRAGGLAGPPEAPRFLFLTLPMATLVVFPTLLGAALWFRQRTDLHKRLILLATLELVTAAVARLPVVGAVGPVAFFGVTDLFVVAIAIYDWRTLRRIHPATLWGGLLLVASQPLRLMIGATAMWDAFGTWLVS